MVVNIKLDNVQDEDYVHLLYFILLGRKGSKEDVDYWKNTLKKSDRIDVLKAFVGSPEFGNRINRVYAPDLLSLFHGIRCDWVRTLPPAKKILDIGGAASPDNRGSLIWMGYPHKPQKIIIVDHPPREQLFKPNYEQHDVTLQWGGIVHYHYQDMTKLKNEFVEEKFDMVFMGQTVEHLPKNDFIEKLLPFIKNRLNENGFFIFDTPNRSITEIQVPDKFINDDHDYEYRPTELKEILEKNGFRVEEEWGMIPMPNTLKSKKWLQDEYVNSIKIVRNPVDCYSFAFKCKAVND